MNEQEESELWNLSDASEKQRLMRQIAPLKGLYEVKIKPRKRTRTLNQNSYYWSCVVKIFRDWLRENCGDNFISSEQAHEMLKVKILGLDEKVNKETGESFSLIPRSKTLNTDEFGNYIESCAMWLQDFCDVTVIPPDVYFEGQGK